MTEIVRPEPSAWDVLENAEFHRVCDLFAAKGAPRLLLPASSTTSSIATRMACEVYTSLVHNASVQLFTPAVAAKIDVASTFQPNVRERLIESCVSPVWETPEFQTQFKDALELLERLDAELHASTLADFAPSTRESVFRDLVVVQRASHLIVLLDEQLGSARVLSSSPRLNLLIAFALVVNKRVSVCYRTVWVEFRYDAEEVEDEMEEVVRKLRKVQIETDSPQIDGKKETLAVFSSDTLEEETVSCLTSLFLDTF